MWLLDVNIDLRVVDLLAALGQPAESAISQGWRELRNGHLLKKAVENNYSSLLTRDKLFHESAKKVFEHNPNFSIVLIDLPQAKYPQYLESFKMSWNTNPIKPVSGKCIIWPGGS